VRQSLWPSRRLPMPSTRHLPSECARVLPWPAFAIPQVRPVAPRMREWWRPARGEKGRAHRLGHTNLSPSRLVCMPRPSPRLAVVVLLRAIRLPRVVLRADVHDADAAMSKGASLVSRSSLGLRMQTNPEDESKDSGIRQLLGVRVRSPCAIPCNFPRTYRIDSR
jgi:hypothetical protein